MRRRTQRQPLDIDMTPEQIKLVQVSFKSVNAIAPQAADLFYDRLFHIAPNLRPLFPADLTEQKRKLMAMIGTVVGNLHQVDKIVPVVQDLGRRHATYGVKASHYQSVGDALIWTLGKGLGPGFTDSVKDAWTAAYSTLATVMSGATETPTPRPEGLRPSATEHV
jgi:hemoglobin-like flavoprotein